MYGNIMTVYNNIIYYAFFSHFSPIFLLILVSIFGYYYHYPIFTDERILFFNDLHYQENFNPYGSSHNGCSSNSTNSGVPSLYGIYGCNSPPRLIHSFFKFLKTHRKPSMIIFGGDSVSLPEKTDKAYLKWMDYFMSTLSNIYPSTPILITLGNNEFVHNYGSFDTDHHDFHLFSQALSPYLKSDQIETIQKGGYYYHDLPSQNLRIIVLNSIMYLTKMSRKNHNETDPWEQLSWLQSIIKDARRKKMEIILTMHAPPNPISPEKPQSGWNQIYLNQFSRIIKKYNIHQILVGHSHLDLIFPIYSEEQLSQQLNDQSPQFNEEIYDQINKNNKFNQLESQLLFSNNKTLNHCKNIKYNKNIKNNIDNNVLVKEDGFVALSSPSISPKHGNNPAFRIYKLRKGKVYDYDQYYTDISLINYENNYPKWKKHYSFLNTYHIKDFGSFHEKIANSPKKTQIYKDNMWVNALPFKKSG